MKQCILASLAVMALANGSATAQEMTLFIDSQDKRVHNDIVGHFRAYPRLTDGLKIRANSANTLSANVEQHLGPTVYVHTARTVDADKLDSILSALGKLDAPATLMLFFDTAANYKWIKDVRKPNNVKLTLSVRKFDQQEVARAYEKFNVNYNASALRYRYGLAVEFALAQMNKKRRAVKSYALKAWSPEISALTVFDSDAISSGSSATNRANFIRNALNEDSIVTAKKPTDNGVVKWSSFNNKTTNDMIAISRFLAASNCTNDWKWDGMIEVGMKFQSFGQ